MNGSYLLDQNPDRISFAVCLALAVHVVIVFAVGFIAQLPGKSPPRLEVTLAHYASDRAPDKADYLAAVNQRGSGTLAHKAQLTTTRLTPIPAAHPAPVERHRPRREQRSASTAVVHTRTAPRQQPKQVTRDAVRPHATNHPANDAEERRRHEIANLQARLDRERQAYARRPRIHRITSVSTKASADARYQLQWQQKVERAGNRHYPEQARQRKLEGDVRLMVALTPDGRVKVIEILASSGNAILDRAAVRSVRLAAPFEPFPPAIRSKADILEIIRTWQFRQNHFRSSVPRHQ